ncbi:SMC-Scp complex subunit ScpB [Rickettsiella massiliensis]|uniref:SMC-Scp complex subunit ScpB n=1 Tax=Rickettsiella massiliensis TaxID=676517 RepID=UPI001F1DC1D3|nr:SMC-Scp complex subunit ScpB [Rickettsiella massiliensis]
MQQLKSILEAALLAAGEPVSLSRLVSLFEKEEAVTKKQIEQALLILQEEAALRGIRLQEVASGYCFTSATDFSPWLKKLWPEKKVTLFSSVLRNIGHYCL